MELEGHIENITYTEETPYIRHIDFYYGFAGLRHIVVWTDVNSNQYESVMQAFYSHRRVGIRYDRETNELLAIWN